MRERIGYEFESYNHYDSYEGIKDNLKNEHNLPIQSVKEDISLDLGGYEINSSVFNGIDEFKENFMKMIDVIKEIGHDAPKSPAAIHIHISNIPKPYNFFLVANSYFKFFKRIVDANKSYISFKGPAYEFKESKQEVKKKESFLGVLRNCMISGSRGEVIRRTGYSLEFRPIPTRLEEEYLETWLQIYEILLRKSQEMDMRDCYQKYKSLQLLDTVPEFFELEKKHIIALGGTELLKPREKNRFFDELTSFELRNQDRSKHFPMMSINNPAHVWMHNVIYGNKEWKKAAYDNFIVRGTHIAHIYNWGREKFGKYPEYKYERREESLNRKKSFSTSIGHSAVFSSDSPVYYEMSR